MSSYHINKQTVLSGQESIEQLISLCQNDDSIMLNTPALVAFLKRFQAGAVDNSFVERIANLFENENVAYATGKEQRIANVVFELSSPEINGVLTHVRCDELLERLGEDHVK